MSNKLKKNVDIIKNKVEIIKENKPLRIAWNIGYTILVIFVLLLLFIVILQRVSNNSMSIGGLRIFNIISESMVPKYKIGDVLIAKEIEPTEIKVGDDVVYKGAKYLDGKIITHRVIEIEKENGGLKFHTKGIANQEEDLPITADQICGKIIYKIRTLSFVSKIVTNLYSFYFVIFIPVVIILFIDIRKTILSLKEEKEEKNNKNK